MGQLIEVMGLNKDYDEHTKALRGVTFSVSRGEWVSVMGPSGSGKTTLLNILGCLDSATSGTVKIGDTAITALGQGELTRFRARNIGLVFQQYHLIPHLSALENVMMAQYFAGSVDEDDAREVLGQVGMDDRLDHMPPHLSGGEQLRVCRARGVDTPPRLLLADEPTGNLDSDNGRKVLGLLKELHDDGRTIVMVTHSPEVASASDRILKLADARLVSDVSIRGKKARDDGTVEAKFEGGKKAKRGR
jgi:putative ABC transport system ATP-binding protein